MLVATVCVPDKIREPKARIEESSLPVALVQYLADYPHIRKVVLRLDNDPAGRIAAATIKTLLSKRYPGSSNTTLIFFSSLIEKSSFHRS